MWPGTDGATLPFMRRRTALLSVVVLAASGCGDAVTSSTGPAIGPPPTVAPLAFTFATDGPILDLFCPDAVGRPLLGLDPDADVDDQP